MDVCDGAGDCNNAGIACDDTDNAGEEGDDVDAGDKVGTGRAADEAVPEFDNADETGCTPTDDVDNLLGENVNDLNDANPENDLILGKLEYAND